MKLAICTDVYGNLPFPEMLDKVKSQGITGVEMTAGGYTMCLTPLFIRYLPAVYAELTDGTLFKARDEWGLDEFLQKNHY